MERHLKALEGATVRLQQVTEKLSIHLLKPDDGVEMVHVAGWWLPRGDNHFASILVPSKGKYQHEARDTALKYVKNFRVAVDVGAHVGLWSRDLAKKFMQVHAFEPSYLSRVCLVRNISLSNLTAYGCAIGKKVGKGKNLRHSGNTGGYEVIREKDGDIQILPLDSFGFQNVDFIKIDVQGAELDVLQGAEETLKRCKPIVVVEESNDLPNKQIPIHAPTDFLVSLGARVLGQVRKDVIMGWPV